MAWNLKSTDRPMSMSQEEVSMWNSTFQSVLKCVFFFNFGVPAGLTNLNLIGFYFLKKKKKKTLSHLPLYFKNTVAKNGDHGPIQPLWSLTKSLEILVVLVTGQYVCIMSLNCTLKNHCVFYHNKKVKINTNFLNKKIKIKTNINNACWGFLISALLTFQAK